MAVDLKERLKGHALSRVLTIKFEYDKQVHKWVPYLNLIADAQIAALKAHDTVLKLVEKAQTANNELALLALTIVGGIAIAWAKGLVKNKLYPKYFGKTEFKDVFTQQGWKIQSSRHWDEQMADFVGDSVEKVLEVTFDRSMDKVFPKEMSKRTEPQGLVGAIASGDVASFKTELINALENEIGKMTGALGLMYTNITNDQFFGSKILEALTHLYPRLNTNPVRETESDIVETLGKSMLDTAFDKLRQTYADKARYYGNNPGALNLAYTTRHFEIVIWALYLLDQDFKFQPGSVGDFPRPFVIKGKDGLRLNHIIIGHLFDDLGIVGTGMRDAEFHSRPTSLGLAGILAGETDPLIESDDLKAILDWAKSAPTTYAGGVDYTPRTIGTVRDAASIFGTGN